MSAGTPTPESCQSPIFEADICQSEPLADCQPSAPDSCPSHTFDTCLFPTLSVKHPPVPETSQSSKDACQPSTPETCPSTVIEISQSTNNKPCKSPIFDILTTCKSPTFNICQPTTLTTCQSPTSKTCISPNPEICTSPTPETCQLETSKTCQSTTPEARQSPTPKACYPTNDRYSSTSLLKCQSNESIGSSKIKSFCPSTRETWYSTTTNCSSTSEAWFSTSSEVGSLGEQIFISWSNLLEGSPSENVTEQDLFPRKILPCNSYTSNA